MYRFLEQIVRTRIQAGSAWTPDMGSCSNAVVCWLWCLEHTAYIGGHPASGANPNSQKANGASAGHPGNFLDFLQSGPGGLKSSVQFITRMATQVGTRQRILTTFSLHRGMLVVWLDNAGAFRHVAVNGGNNTLYGYNQGGGFYNPQCGARGSGHSHPQHRWCPRRAEHLSTSGYKNRTVSAEKAMAFFLQHHDNHAMW